MTTSFFRTPFSPSGFKKDNDYGKASQICTIYQIKVTLKLEFCTFCLSLRATVGSEAISKLEIARLCEAKASLRRSRASSLRSSQCRAAYSHEKGCSIR